MKALKIANFILIAALTLTLFSGCAQKAQGEVSVQRTPVEAYKIAKGNIESTYIVSGQMKPISEVTVTPKAAGKVEDVMKDLGDRVEVGEKLFVIETTSLYKQLAQINAQLVQSEAGITLASIGLQRSQGSSLTQQLMQAEQAVEQAKINYDTSKSDYENNKALYEAGALSKQMLENIKNKYELAEIQYSNAKENLQLLKEKIAQESIQSAQAQLNQAEAGKEILEAQKELLLQQIEDSVVKAPISGIVASENVEIGQMVSQQTPAYTIVDMDKVVVETNVTERIINKIAAGQEVVVTIKALGNKEFKGIVDALSPATANMNIGYPVKIVIDNQNHEIKPGMFAEVKFITQRKENAVLVPLEAVISNGDAEYVFVLQGDRVEKREIKTGFKDGTNYEVISGLQDGEQIIIKGQHFIVDGEQVRLIGGEQ